MHFSVRVGYPENNEFIWSEALQKYTDIGCIEVAFYSTELFIRNVKLEEVTEPFSTIPLNVSSVHMAHVSITDFPLFELVLDKTIQIAKALKCQNIIVHPSKSELNEVKNFIDTSITKMLNHEKMYLCWETFSSKKRFLSGVAGVAEFCHDKHWHRMCYDFSHIHDNQETVIKQILKYMDIIKIFHISNRITEKELQHLPIFHKGIGDLDLDFLPILKQLKEKDYDGTLVLEYMPEFQNQLISDAEFLINKYGD